MIGQDSLEREWPDTMTMRPMHRKGQIAPTAMRTFHDQESTSFERTVNPRHRVEQQATTGTIANDSLVLYPTAMNISTLRKSLSIR